MPTSRRWHPHPDQTAPMAARLRGRALRVPGSSFVLAPSDPKPSSLPSRVRWHSSVSPLTLQYSVATNKYERQPNQDVQNIIRPRPQEILFGRKIRKTGDHLVKINQPKPKIKAAYERIFPRPQNNQSRGPKEDMEDIVRRGAAGETVLRRHQKSCHARQDQHRGEDRQGYEVDALLIDRR